MLNSFALAIPAENKFSTTDILTRFDRTKFMSAMRQTANLDRIKTHYVYSNRYVQ